MRFRSCSGSSHAPLRLERVSGTCCFRTVPGFAWARHDKNRSAADSIQPTDSKTRAGAAERSDFVDSVTALRRECIGTRVVRSLDLAGMHDYALIHLKKRLGEEARRRQ